MWQKFNGSYEKNEDELYSYCPQNIEELFEEYEHTKAARKLLLGLPVVGKLDDV